MLIFHYRGPQCFSDDPCPDGLHYWFSYAYETRYDFENVDAITADYSASCSPDRGADGTKAFFGINHFVSLPNDFAAKELGTVSMLKERISKCSAVNNDQPVSAILVDFASETSLLEVTQLHNKALARRRAA
jgi:hypothetical protein